MLKIPFNDGFSPSGAGASLAAGRASLGTGMPKESDGSWRRSATPGYLQVGSEGWQALVVPAQPVCRQVNPAVRSCAAGRAARASGRVPGRELQRLR